MAPIIKDEEEQRRENEQQRRREADQHQQDDRRRQQGQRDQGDEDKQWRDQGEYVSRPDSPERTGGIVGRHAPGVGLGGEQLPAEKAYDPKRKQAGAREGEDTAGGGTGTPSTDPLLYTPNLPLEVPPEDRWMMFAQQAATQRYPRLRVGVDYVIGRRDVASPVELLYCEEGGEQVDMGLVQQDAQLMSDADPTNPEAQTKQTSLASSYHPQEVATGEAPRPEPR